MVAQAATGGGQGDLEVTAIFACVVNSRPAWATREPVSRNKNNVYCLELFPSFPTNQVGGCVLSHFLLTLDKNNCQAQEISYWLLAF